MSGERLEINVEDLEMNGYLTDTGLLIELVDPQGNAVFEAELPLDRLVRMAQQILLKHSLNGGVTN